MTAGAGPQSDGATAPGALAAMFGLDAIEHKALGRLFEETMRALGLDGARVFARLDAGQTLREALDLPPGTVDLLYARAHQWFSVGRTDKALALFRTLCALAPDADHWVGYGVCLGLTGAEREAAAAFEAAAQLRPDWAVPHFHLTGLALRVGAVEAAAQAMARFDATLDDGVPDDIRAEQERLRVALSLARGPGAAP